MIIQNLKEQIRKLENFEYTEQDYVLTIDEFKEKLEFIRFNVDNRIHMKLIRNILIQTNDEDLTIDILNTKRDIPSPSAFDLEKARQIASVQKRIQALKDQLKQEEDAIEKQIMISIRSDVQNTIELAMNKWENYLETISFTLDEDVFIRIVSFLSLEDQYNCRLVNKYWAHCLSTNAYWKYLTLRKFNTFIRHLTSKYLVNTEYDKMPYKTIFYLMREDIKQLNFAKYNNWKDIKLVNTMESLSEASMIRSYKLNISHAHEFRINPVRRLLNEPTCLVHIFEYLSLNVLLTCRNTCRSFYRLLDDIHFWKPLVLSKYPLYLDTHKMYHTTDDYKKLSYQFYILDAQEKRGKHIEHAMQQLLQQKKVVMTKAIWQHVSLYIDDDTLFSLLQVCQTLNTYFKDNTFWQSRFQEFFVEHHDRLSRVYRSTDLFYQDVYVHYAKQKKIMKHVEDWEGLDELYIMYKLEKKVPSKQSCCILL